MSISRQQRRAMKRKLNKVTNEQAEAAILALREHSASRREAARGVAPGIYEKLKREAEPIVAAQATADTLIMILGFLHIDKGHTGKYISKWLHDFNAFGDAVNNNGQGLQPILDILRDECGLDINKEFALCEIESNRAAEERRKRFKVV